MKKLLFALLAVSCVQIFASDLSDDEMGLLDSIRPPRPIQTRVACSQITFAKTAYRIVIKDALVNPGVLRLEAQLLLNIDPRPRAVLSCVGTSVNGLACVSKDRKFTFRTLLVGITRKARVGILTTAGAPGRTIESSFICE